MRALHHYDAIGLLRPSTRSGADYRLYGNDDIRALRRIRRYQALGFSLEEVRELLTASGQDRLAALRKQRDAIQQRAAETDGVVRAINREITAETGGGTEPPVHGCRHDWANVAELCRRFLAQTSDWEDRAFAALELVGALTMLERHEEAVDVHRAYIEAVMAQRPPEEWADAMWNSTHGRCWVATGQRAGWMALFQAVDAGLKATAENRGSRYELLHTAVMLMGADHDTYASDGEALTQLADIIAEDPDWSERLWAEQRFEQQKVGNAVRRGDPDAVTQAASAYRSFLESCDWPAQWLGCAYSNLGAIMHWENRHGSAVDCFTRAQQERELDGYGYAWFAAASLAVGASRERVTELLADAGRRLESADAMRIFNEDAVLSRDADREDLLDALLQPA